MTIRDTNGPSPLSSTPSVPPTCPTNTSYAGKSVTLSPGLQITGLQELEGTYPELEEVTNVSAVKNDDPVEKLQGGGSRFSRRAVISSKGQQLSRVHSR